MLTQERTPSVVTDIINNNLLRTPVSANQKPAFGHLPASMPMQSSPLARPMNTDSVLFSGRGDNGDKPDKPKGEGKEKAKAAFSRTGKWMRTYALMLALIPGGAFATGLGIDGAGSHPSTTTPIMRMANPEDLSKPIEISGPAAVDRPVTEPTTEAPEANRLPAADSVITPEVALQYAEHGQVSDLTARDGHAGQFTITIVQPAHDDIEEKHVSVHVPLNAEEYEQLLTIVAFGANESTIESDAPTTLPAEAEPLTPSELRDYANGGMLLELEKSTATLAKGTTQPAGTSHYVYTLTDGDSLVSGEINLTPQQATLIRNGAVEHLARYTSTRTSGGGATKQDVWLILMGLGLIGGGGAAGWKTRRRQKELDYTRPTVIPKPNYTEAPYRKDEGLLATSSAAAAPAAAPQQPDVAKKLEEQLPAGFKRPKVSFSDMAGIGRQTMEDIEELLEVLTTDEETMEQLGIEPIKGALLYGPPGTGKTMMAEAVAHATGRIYKCISASSLGTTELKGNGGKKIREEFAKVHEAAKTGQPILLQLDEVDSLFGDRTNAHDEDAQTLNQFLTEIDKLHETAPNVVILYTTNHLKKLDGAAIRNGRVDYKIKVPLPATKQQRLEILDLYAKKPKPRAFAEDVDLDVIAEKTQGFSPIDLRGLMNKASIRAKLNGHTSIHQSDLLQAVVIIDRQRKKDSTMLTSVERPTTKFSDLGGLKDIIPQFEEIAGVISKMASGSKTAEVAEDEPELSDFKPIMMVGSPGTGKTELGRAMANEAQCNFMYANGAEFEDGIVGHGAQNVKKLFEDARENGPTILFIDEFDAVAGKRGGHGGSDERDKTLNMLLTEINGLKPNDGVFIMTATNRPDIIDSAVKSRFETISVPKPSTPEARREVIDVVTKKYKLAEDVDLAALADDTTGYSGRDYKGLMQIAARMRRKDGMKEITRKHIDEAVDIHELGEKSAYPGSPTALRLVGIHEIIGHGLLAMALKRRIPEVKIRAVTMEARRANDAEGGGGQVLGFVRPAYPDGIDHSSIATYLAQILVFAGGRASERVIVSEMDGKLGSDTAGGGSDYQQIENRVIHMLQSGMIPGFSPNQFAKSKNELTPQEMQVVDFLVGQAEKFSEKLIRTAVANHPEKMVELVENGIAAKTVRNEEAEALFTDVLTEPQDWAPLYDVVDEYLKETIGFLQQKARTKQNAFIEGLQPPPENPGSFT